MTQEQYSLGKILPPSTITFFTDNGATDVMKITKEGIWVNPNLTVDKAATAVIEALDEHIKALVKRQLEKVEAQRDELLEANADLLKQLSSYQIDWESQEDLLEQLYWAFVEDRENEKSSFKEKMKFFAGQINQYANELIAALRTKRQPLSDKFIIDMSEQAGHTALETAMFLAGVRTAEQAHGIGVEE